MATVTGCTPKKVSRVGTTLMISMKDETAAKELEEALMGAMTTSQGPTRAQIAFAQSHNMPLYGME